MLPKPFRDAEQKEVWTRCRQMLQKGFRRQVAKRLVTCMKRWLALDSLRVFQHPLGIPISFVLPGCPHWNVRECRESNRRGCGSSGESCLWVPALAQTRLVVTRERAIFVVAPWLWHLLPREAHLAQLFCPFKPIIL